MVDRHPAPHPPSLKIQLTLVFGTLVVLASLVLTYGLGEMLRGRVRADAGRSLVLVASNASQVLAAGLQANADIVSSLVRRPELWQGGLASPQVRQAVDLIHAAQPATMWVGVADEHGTVQSALGGLLEGQSVRERPWFQQGRAQLFVGDLHPAKLLASLLPPQASGEPLRFLDYSGPVVVDGRHIGVLGVHASWSWAADIIGTVLPAEARDLGIEIFIFNEAGNLIYAPAGQSQKLADAGVRLPSIPPGTVGAVVVPWYDGAAYLTAGMKLAARAPVSDLGWTIVAREPADRAFLEVKEATRQALAIGLLTALIGSLLAGLAAHRLSTDVNRMARAARDLEADVPNARIPRTAGSAELQTLADALGSMTQRLVGARNALEHQVRERTLALEAANAELGRQAQTDALTGLLNRRAFDPLLERTLADARRNQRPLSILMIDADHFKRVNDAFGHGVGDEVLRMLAGVLRLRLRATDVVARFGGEEFVVLLPETGMEDGLRTARELIETIAGQHHPVYGTITVSIGVSTCSDGTTRAADLLRRADEALYRAKDQGRNRACGYEPVAPA
ncbi:sensor domain-containing diguanylate cyclase [Xylophilus ampelinus]|uniref:diguanylate cyclase n=1 Tax=Xylophilus ampelinus TaxID=54067 RepID=A0A318SS36_9BURK|nr:sensor domain-containing diguanylate cyclase [Xylophilus ampelinus]MCS4510870.1 diguanylate cyclase [Xylophilus ampelinus]PYE76149.1 diguanylate cyclase [Xylophilus ampelinus]